MDRRTTSGFPRLRRIGALILMNLAIGDDLSSL